MRALLTRPSYFVRRALEAIVRAPRIAGVVVATIAVATFVTGLVAGALHGAERLLAAWAGETQISVYLDARADLAVARAAAAAIAPGLGVEAVSAREALQRFRDALGPEGALVDGVAEGVLPPSIEVRAPGVSVPAVRALAARLQAVPGAREVDFGDAWLEKLDHLLRRLRWAGAALLAAIAVGAAALVAGIRFLWPHPAPADTAGIVLLATALQLVGTPLLSALSRAFERVADRESVRLTGDRAAYRRLHHRLAVANLSELEPPKWLCYWGASHPTAPQRLHDA
jgi:hypothetical protein